MKTKKILFFVSFVILLTTLGSGCASTPKVVQTVPVYSTPAATNTAPPSPYYFSQEPVKRVIADEGKEYRAHVREVQYQRLAHERQLAAIEQAAEEQKLATERGVSLQPQPQPQTVPQSTAPATMGGAMYPTGYPYPGASGTAIYPTGYPYQSGYGSKWWQFFGGGGDGPQISSTYNYNAVGIGGFSYLSGLAGGGNPCQTQKAYKWQSSPGYRHLWGGGSAIYPGAAIYPTGCP